MAAIDADGMIWTWGAGGNGALGNGFTSDSAYPVQVMVANAANQAVPLPGMSQVACGSSGFCIALSRDGTVYGWGNNSFSQMGVAPGGALSIATPIGVGPGGIDMIAAGAAHCIARSGTDGKVYGWGYNGYGQLGAGFANVAQHPPVAMSAGPEGMNDITELAAGSNFSLMGRFTDRAVFGSGDNQSGQLSPAPKGTNQYVPVRIR
jgi:alpha-tubulin suppressor-like RCC1 family protein